MKIIIAVVIVVGLVALLTWTSVSTIKDIRKMIKRKNPKKEE